MSRTTSYNRDTYQCHDIHSLGMSSFTRYCKLSTLLKVKMIKAVYALTFATALLVLLLLNCEGFFGFHDSTKSCFVTRGDTNYVLPHSICSLHVGTSQLQSSKEFTQGLRDDYPNGLNTWQNVSDGGSIFVFSAFPDNVDGNSYIRVLVMLKKQNNYLEPPEVVCLLHDRGFGSAANESTKPRTILVTEPAAINIIPDHHRKLYKPAFVMCPLPWQTTKPKFVSLALLGRIEIHPPRNLLKVTYNTGTRNFTVCLSPLFFQTNVARELVQWIEMNRLLGADVFFVYNHTSNAQTNQVLRHYARAGLVRVIQWELSNFIQSPDDVWYYAQNAAINDCLYRSKGVSKYLVNIDLDEYIFPRGVAYSWKDILAREIDTCDYNFRGTVVVMNSVPETVNRNNILCCFDLPFPVQNNGSASSLYDTVEHFNLFTLSKQTRRHYVFESTIRSKYIVKPDCIDTLGIHLVWKYSSNRCVKRHDVSIHNAMVYHYANQRSLFATVGITKRDLVTTKYKNTLITAVSNTWNQLQPHHYALSGKSVKNV